MRRTNLCLVMVLVGLFVLVFGAGGSPARADEPGWSEPVNLSAGPGWSSTPTLAAAPDGTLHALWAEADYVNDTPRTIYYSHWDGSNWSQPRDIIAFSRGGGMLEVSSAVVDSRGMLHLSFIDEGTQLGYYSHAPLAVADSAHAWVPPVVIDTPLYSPVKLLVDNNGTTLHMAYVRFGPQAGLYYRRSPDGGRSWSIGTLVTSATSADIGPAGLSMTLDSRDRLHLVWFEKYLSKGYKGTAILYSRSSDGGETWSSPITLDKLDERYKGPYGPNWPAIAAIGDRKLVVVWDGAPRGERHYTWSTDGGQTWSGDTPTGWTFRGITDRQGLVVDSAGTVHWVTGASGRLYYSYWAAGSGEWANPIPVDTLAHDPHRPTLVVVGGNRLGVVWNDQSVAIKDWFATRLVPAPYLPPQPLPTYVSQELVSPTLQTTPSVVQPEASPTVFPTPSVLETSPSAPRGSPANPIVVAVLPVVLLLGIVAVVQLRRRDRR